MVDLLYLDQRMMVLTVGIRHITAVQFCDVTDRPTDQILRSIAPAKPGLPPAVPVSLDDTIPTPGRVMSGGVVGTPMIVFPA